MLEPEVSNGVKGTEPSEGRQAFESNGVNTNGQRIMVVGWSVSLFIDIRALRRLLCPPLLINQKKQKDEKPIHGPAESIHAPPVPQPLAGA